MRLTIDYGKTGLTIQVPDTNLAGVLGLRPQLPLPDPDAAIRAALASPTGTPPLAELASGRRSACVVISDITRPVLNRVLLPPILAALAAAGIPTGRTLILVATGTHRPNLGDELVSMVGEEVVREYRIENHDARDLANHMDLGRSPRGVPMLVDRRYLDADLRITTALIEPHFMAGYSGGRKSVCPGLCGLETVKVWHGPHFIGHPRSDSGILDGNPEHEEALFIARQAGVDFIVDVTIDEQRRLTGVFAGDLEQAWLAGVRSVEEAVRAPLPEPVDIVITSSAGYPLDLTFYQTVKGMVAALPIVKPGGTVIIAARCAEGIGSREFRDSLLGSDDIEAFVARTYEAGFFVPDQWEVHELAKAVRQAEVLCYTEGIPAETLARCFVTPIPSVEAGLAQALARHGRNARIAVIPRGPYVVPVIEPEGCRPAGQAA
ncbi:MAG: nickel-dependent lactate racemase [Armatimonadetes bacterium]|nr:nickel-dependent lactate racemase [Armatimonadota bacterium]